ncbi:hypothetical protein F4818DRAFT_53776 [Hypoxylon cercidicola]|nr:hypothetical protein F4818DRAFT_53776 [Hypoxylon cercidicola]
MHLTSSLTLFLVACSSATSQKFITLPDTSNAPFSPPVIRSVSFSGNGCPQSGGTKHVSGGWQHFAFTLPDFAASYGGSKPKSVNCQAHMNLEGGEPGWQVAVKEIWTKGHLELEPDVKLTQYITAYYSQDAANTVRQTSRWIHVYGMPMAVANWALIQVSAVQTVTSPPDSTLSKDVTLHSTIPSESIVWSPCTGSNGNVGILNVNFRIAFTSANADSYGFYGGGRNSTVNERWGWTWRRC